MSAVTIIAQAFGEDAIEDLYTKVLGLKKENKGGAEHDDESPSPTPSQLRKAYYRRALLFHPDKQGGKPDEEVKIAKLKFQAISVAYNILSDEEKRKVYDDTGELDDGDDDDANSSSNGKNVWEDYFSNIFGKATTKDIDAFTESYKCSHEEEKDVLKYYVQFKGDFDKMLECVMCSDDIDVNRWIEDYIKPSIHKGEIEDYLDDKDGKANGNDDDSEEDVNEEDGDLDVDLEDSEDDDEDETETEEEDDDESPKTRTKKKHASSSKRKPAKAKPSLQKNTKRKPKTKANKKKNKDPPVSEDLIAAIRGRRSGGGGGGFGSILASLEERYAAPSKSKKKKKGKGQDDDDIPDDEFEKIQKRLDTKRRKKK